MKYFYTLSTPLDNGAEIMHCYKMKFYENSMMNIKEH
jgi:hypothetical protein